MNEAENVVARQLQRVLGWLLEAVDELDEEQLAWRPSASAPAIRFHVFHLARCSDDAQSVMTGRGPTIWEREGLAAAWGLDPEALGWFENGATIGADAAAALAWPARETLLEYLRRATTALDATLGEIDDREFAREIDGYGGERMTLGYVVTDQLEHTSRHLGMIEALRGALGLDGTATV